jgi:hypothetical protein
MKHWHQAFGIPGYGPEGGDNQFATAKTIYNGLDTLMYDGLKEAAEMVGLDIRACSDAADYCRDQGHDKDELDNLRGYQAANKLWEEIGVHMMNVDVNRPHGTVGEWEAKILRYMGDNFPMDITDNTRLYVWECEFPNECQHITYECKHCLRDVSRDGEGGWVDDGGSRGCSRSPQWVHEGDVPVENPS